MTLPEAENLVRFMHDHDTRFTATAQPAEGTEENAALLQIIEKSGKEQEPIHTLEEFEQRLMVDRPPEASVREAWAKFRREH